MTGPEGQKRYSEPVRRAVQVAQIATGEIDEGAPLEDDESARAGHARAKALTPERRSEISKMAAEARWGKKAVAG